MALWRAPWDRLFVRPRPVLEDDFQLIDDTDATSDFGVRSVPSEACTMSQKGSLSRRHSWAPASDIVPASAAYRVHQRRPLDLVDQHRFTDERLYSTVSRKDANTLENAGRRYDGHDFRDVRSGDKNRRRRREDLDKYYSYRAVNRGQLSVEHHVVEMDLNKPAALQQDMPLRKLSKRDFFSLAQAWPKPPTRSRRDHSKHCWLKTSPPPLYRVDEMHDEKPDDSDVEQIGAALREEYRQWLEYEEQVQAASMAVETRDMPFRLDRRVFSQRERMSLSKACG